MTYNVFTNTKMEIDRLITSIKSKLEYLTLRDGESALYLELWKIQGVQVNSLDDLTFKLESLYSLNKKIAVLL